MHSTRLAVAAKAARILSSSNRANDGSSQLSGELVLSPAAKPCVSDYSVAGAFDSGSVVDLTQAVTAISSSAASTGVWAVLLGRCLVAAVRETQQLQHALAASCTGNGRGQEAAAQLLALAVACRGAVKCIMQQLPRAPASAGGSSAAGGRPGKAAAVLVMPGAVVQTLLQQQAQLLQTLEQVAAAATAAVAASEAISSQAAAGGAEAGPATDQTAAAAAANGAHQRLVEAAADLATQLEAAGAAVAAQQPLRYCCNWHRCSSAAQRSEAELVSGASSVCSRECQLAHWPDWHKAVCRRIPSGSGSG